MIEFNIEIPRDVNLSSSTVISHENGDQTFKISNFIEKLEKRVVNIQDQINNQILQSYIHGHLKDYRCPQALTDGLVCEVLSPSSPEWRSGKLHVNVKVSFSVDFEFVEDHQNLPEDASNSASTLDDIRQSIGQGLS